MDPLRLRSEKNLSTTNKYKAANQFKQRDTLAKWRASGLSQAEFCRRERVPEWALSSWKRRELELAGETPTVKRRKRAEIAKRQDPRKVEFASVEESAQSGRSVPGFVPLVSPRQEEHVQVDAGSPVAELCFRTASIRIWSGIDQDTLRTLLQLLRENMLC